MGVLALLEESMSIRRVGQRVTGVVRIFWGGGKGGAKDWQKREFFFLIGGFWGLRGINQLAIVCRATVLLGDMVVVVAGVVGLLILVVEVLIHVAVAVVEPQLLLLDSRLVALQAGHVGVLVVVGIGVGFGAAGHARML